MRPGLSDPLGDLGRALRVCREHPGLPVGTALVAVLGALTSVRGGLGAVATLLAVAAVGWVGTERLWYLRAWTGRTLSPGEAVRTTLRCFVRFLLLGLLAGFLYLVLAAPALVAVARAALDALGDPAALDVPVWAVVYLVVALVLLDVLGTFVTPALVYSTRRVGEAVALGLLLLRRTWPHAALYVVLPPLAVVLGNAAAGPATGVAVVTVVVAALVNLVVKGAVAAYYLRLVEPVGPDGAAGPVERDRPLPSPEWRDHR